MKKKDKDPCWDTHQMVGMKMKNGRKVPNCVPKESKTFSSFRQVSELKKSTLASYIGKASHDVATKSALTRHFATKSQSEKDKENFVQARKDDETSNKMFAKSWKRRQGIQKAANKLAGGVKIESVEEVEEGIQKRVNKTRKNTFLTVKGSSLMPTKKTSDTAEWRAQKNAFLKKGREAMREESEDTVDEALKGSRADPVLRAAFKKASENAKKKKQQAAATSVKEEEQVVERETMRFSGRDSLGFKSRVVAEPKKTNSETDKKKKVQTLKDMIKQRLNKEDINENLRLLAQKGIGAERKGDIKVGHGVDYYHPKDGSKHMGKIHSMTDKGYTVKDDRTGEKHTFSYYKRMDEAAKWRSSSAAKPDPDNDWDRSSKSTGGMRASSDTRGDTGGEYDHSSLQNRRKAQVVAKTGKTTKASNTSLKNRIRANMAKKQSKPNLPEEFEQMDEVLDTIEKRNKYLNAAVASAETNAANTRKYWTGAPSNATDRAARIVKNRDAGTKRVMNKIMKKEEAEQIDELKRDTLISYVGKARAKNIKDAAKNRLAGIETSLSDMDKASAKTSKRSKGIQSAYARLNKEEFEQIDENNLGLRGLVSTNPQSMPNFAYKTQKGKEKAAKKNVPALKSAIKDILGKHPKPRLPEEVEQMEEGTGVTDYNPKSQGGTRKELIAKYRKTKNPEHAAAARRAGATQKELMSASMGEAAYMGKGNHKPGWMLRADPELAKKFKEIDDRKKAQAKYAGKLVRDGKIVKENDQIDETSRMLAKHGDVEVHHQNGIISVKKSGKEVAQGEFDRGSDLFFISHRSFGKGQRPFETSTQIAKHFSSMKEEADEMKINEISTTKKLDYIKAASKDVRKQKGAKKQQRLAGISRASRSVFDESAKNDKEDRDDIPFAGPYRKVGDVRKDKFGNVVKNRAKHLAKMGMASATKKESLSFFDFRKKINENV